MMIKRKHNPDLFLNSDEAKQVESAIRESEKQTSAEIKLIILRHCWDKIEHKAASLFRKYKLHATQHRNAVLILLVTANREFLIYGDQGIHEKVGQDFWEDTRNHMADYFKKDLFGQGLCEGIRSIGEKLTAYFPADKDNPNELSDEIIHEK
jgi:uncharacterized membrane protein